MALRRKRRPRVPGRAVRPVRFLESLEQRILFSFGVTTGTTPTGQTTYVIDNGAALKFSVINGGTLSSTIHMGDVSSIQYRNQEMLASYAESSRYSHYEQGLGSIATVTYVVENLNGWILVTCDDSAEASGAVIQYYAVRRNDNNIYMASLPIDVTNGPGEGRFIAYLSRTVFPNPEAPSDNNGSTGAIEGSDVFGHADGTTTSKFYNMGRRMIDNVYHGLTGSSGGISVGAWMFMGDREHSAGGPFFKDIDFQASASQVEIYNCLFTGHTQTEAYRQGLEGPYALQFTDGAAPVTPDYAWMESLHLQGWIPAAQRGTLTGTASGVPAGHEGVIGLSNTTAQYWTKADAAGHYAIAGIQAGTYTETLYDGELEVGTRTITITAGNVMSANIADTFYTPPAASTVFRIGTWDGTPSGFLNADKISIMHPSDIRMASWTSTPNFVVGTNSDGDWPLVQFMGVNNAQRITFTLTAQQVQNLTLRIGITEAFAGGRNKVTVNAGQSYAWTSTNPTASINLNSRGITRGTWRGDNQLYAFSIPASALRVGVNTLDLPVISGSYVAGQTWLSPNVVYDAIDLVYTSAAAPPTVSSLTVTPAGPLITVGGGRMFAAVARDASGNAIVDNFDWTASRGTIDPGGDYLAPYSAGSDVITAIGTRTRTPGYTVTSSSSTAFGALLTSSGFTTASIINSSVARRGLFYGGSVFDDATHDAAIAPDKTALLPNAAAGFASYSSYSRGVNGVFIDIANLAATLSSSDFTFLIGNDSSPAGWSPAPAPVSVVNRAGAGTGGSTRVMLSWTDHAIQNQWLQVTLKGGAGSASGLAADDVFYFGSAIGDTGNDPADARVDAVDELAARAHATDSALIANPFDFNRDGVVDGADQAIARSNITWFLNQLQLIAPPALAGAVVPPGMLGPLAVPAAPASNMESVATSALTPALDESPQIVARQWVVWRAMAADFRLRNSGWIRTPVRMMKAGISPALVPPLATSAWRGEPSALLRRGRWQPLLTAWTEAPPPPWAALLRPVSDLGLMRPEPGPTGRASPEP